MIVTRSANAPGVSSNAVAPPNDPAPAPRPAVATPALNSDCFVKPTAPAPSGAVNRTIIAARLNHPNASAPPTAAEVVHVLEELGNNWSLYHVGVPQSISKASSQLWLCYDSTVGVLRVVVAGAPLAKDEAILVRFGPKDDMRLGSMFVAGQCEISPTACGEITLTPMPTGLRDHRSVMPRRVDPRALYDLKRGLTPDQMRALAVSCVAVGFGLPLHLIDPQLAARTEDALRLVQMKPEPDLDSIVYLAQELLRSGATPVPVHTLRAARVMAHQHAQPQFAPTRVDACQEWGLSGLASDDVTFDDSEYLSMLVSAHDSMESVRASAQQAFAKAWQAAVPENVGLPIRFTESGSTANSALYSVAAAVVEQRGGKPTAARILFFDGVFGAGLGRAAGMSIGPWGNDAKPDLEHDRIVNPAVPAWPVQQSDELLAVEQRAIESLERQFRDLQVGGLLVEPIMGFDNVSSYRPAFLARVRALADHHRVPIFCDEVLTAARTGKMFSYQHFSGFEPDFICFGKLLQAAGIAPVNRKGIRWPSPIFGGQDEGEPIHLLKGARVLEAIVKRDLIANARDTGEHLLARLRTNGVRSHGVGLLIAAAASSLNVKGSATSSWLDLSRRRNPYDGPRLQRLTPPLSLSAPDIDRILQPESSGDARRRNSHNVSDVLTELGLSAKEAILLLWVESADAPELLSPSTATTLTALTSRLAPLSNEAAKLAGLILQSSTEDARFAGFFGPKSDAVAMSARFQLEGALAALTTALMPAPTLNLSQPTCASRQETDTHHLGDVMVESGPRASNYDERRSPSRVRERLQIGWRQLAHPLLKLAVVTDQRATAFELAASVARRAARARASGTKQCSVEHALLRFSDIEPPSAGALAKWPSADVVVTPTGNDADEQRCLDALRLRFADRLVEPVGALVMSAMDLSALRPLRPGFIDAVSSLCRSENVMLILDETHTAGGVVGSFFAYQNSNPGLVPDWVIAGGALGGYAVSTSTESYHWEGLSNGVGLGVSTVMVDAHTALRVERALHSLWEADDSCQVRRHPAAFENALRGLQQSWGLSPDAKVAGAVARLSIPAAIAQSLGVKRDEAGLARLTFPIDFSLEDLEHFAAELT